MRQCRQLSVVILLGVFCASTAQALDNFTQSASGQHTGVYASHYNPWRPQPKQWGYQDRPNHNHGNGYAPQPYNAQQPVYAAPLSHIPARRYEYRRHVQAVNPYYDTGGGLPWWAGTGAAPYGPWSIGNGWPNGLR